MALLLVLLCMSLVIVKGEGSHCMATTSGAQHGPSMYIRVCCVQNNLRQGACSYDMIKNNSNKHILCLSVRPCSCPPEACGLTNIQVVHMATATSTVYTHEHVQYTRN